MHSTKLGYCHDLSYVATNNVHYARQDQHRLQDILTCIRHNITLDEASQVLRPNSEFYLKSGDEMVRLFCDYPDAIHNTVYIAQQCDFKLTSQLQSLPQYHLPDDVSAEDFLKQLCLRSDRCTPKLEARLDYELQIIHEVGLDNYSR